MAEKLARIFEYRVLLAKTERGGELTPVESLQLARLAAHFPAVVPPLDDRDPYTLLPEPLAVELIDADRIMPGLLRNVGARGMALSVSEPPPLSQMLAVRVRDSRHPIEYTFTGRVVSRVVRGLRGVSIAFEGAPVQSPLVGRSSGVWRAHMSRSRRSFSA